MSWTPEQVLSFAPDAGTAKRGQGLASERNWRLLQSNDTSVWGECASSSLSYYHTQIDLSGPAFKCNCPSRKFPCKHAIGLFLIFATRSDAIDKGQAPPAWVEEWMASRKGKTSEAIDPKVLAERQEKNASQRANNRIKRLEQMAGGVKDLETWLLDLVRQGLASTEQLEYSYWQDISARMVDNKLGGVGLKIRSLPLLQGGNTDWPKYMLSELAELYLLARGLQNLEQLPEPMQDQLLSVAGLNIRKDDLLSQNGIQDNWAVLGQFTGVNIDNGAFRQTWLKGEDSGKDAMLLEYDYRGAGFEIDWPVGRIIAGELVYYPGTYPLRAILKEPKMLLGLLETSNGHPHFSSFFEAYAEATSANPWLLDFPVCLDQVIPVYSEQELFLIDVEKRAIPLVSRDNLQWKLLSLSGGHPVSIFGGWTGRQLVPLSVFMEDRWIAL